MMRKNQWPILYLILGAAVVAVVAVTQLTPDSEVVQRFGPNLATETLAILLTLVFVQRFIDLQHRDGQLEKIRESSSAGLSVDLYVDGRYASHSTSLHFYSVILHFQNRNCPNYRREIATENFAIILPSDLGNLCFSLFSNNWAISSLKNIMPSFSYCSLL